MYYYGRIGLIPTERLDRFGRIFEGELRASLSIIYMTLCMNDQTICLSK